MKWIKHLFWKYVTQDPQYDEDQTVCDKQTFPGIDKDLYGKLLREATAAGAQFHGAEATISGCTFDWNYDEATATLDVTCTAHQFYKTCGEINAKISQLIEQSKGAV